MIAENKFAVLSEEELYEINGGSGSREKTEEETTETNSDGSTKETKKSTEKTEIKKW